MEYKIDDPIAGSSIFLENSNFLTAGRNSKVYVKGDTAYKVFCLRSSNSISEEKIKQLATLDLPHIIKPERILKDQHGQPIGYSMTYLHRARPLASLYSPFVRKQEGFTPEIAFRLVRQMQNTISFIHSKGMSVSVAGALSDENFMISRDFQVVYFISTEKYVYDASDTQKNYDWYNFSIETFKLLVGINPFRGRFSSSTTPGARTVLNPCIKMPQAFKCVGIMPPEYRDWYWRVLEENKLCPPPTTLTEFAPLPPKYTSLVSTNNFEIKKIASFPGEITDYCANGKWDIVVSYEDGKNIPYVGVMTWNDPKVLELIGGENMKRSKMHYPVARVVVGFANDDTPVAAYLDKGKIYIVDLKADELLHFNCYASAVMSYKGRIFILGDSHINELQFGLNSGRMIYSLKPMATPAGTIGDHDVQLFPGIIIRNLSGIRWVCLCECKSQFRLRELEESTIIDAKYESNVLQVMSKDHHGIINRFVFRFGGKIPDVKEYRHVDCLGINFTVLDNGTVATLKEDETIELTRNIYGSKAKTVLRDDIIDSTMRLYHNGNFVFVAKGNVLYHLTMKRQEP